MIICDVAYGIKWFNVELGVFRSSGPGQWNYDLGGFIVDTPLRAVKFSFITTQRSVHYVTRVYGPIHLCLSIVKYSHLLDFNIVNVVFSV